MNGEINDDEWMNEEMNDDDWLNDDDWINDFSRRIPPLKRYVCDQVWWLPREMNEGMNDDRMINELIHIEWKICLSTCL